MRWGLLYTAMLIMQAYLMAPRRLSRTVTSLTVSYESRASHETILWRTAGIYERVYERVPAIELGLPCWLPWDADGLMRPQGGLCYTAPSPAPPWMVRFKLMRAARGHWQRCQRMGHGFMPSVPWKHAARVRGPSLGADNVVGVISPGASR